MAKTKASAPPAPESEPKAPETPAPIELPPPPKPELVTASEINAGVEMPAPNERTIAAIASDMPAAPIFGEKDTWGRPFDPQKFLPRKNSIGNWIPNPAWRNPDNVHPRKRGRPPGRKNSAPASIVGDTEPVVLEVEGPDKYEVAAESYCQLFYFGADVIFSGKGEWRPSSDTERDEMKRCTAAWLRSRQSDDLPPGWALALTVSLYGAARINQPNTAARIRASLRWFRERGGGVKITPPEDNGATIHSAPRPSEFERKD